MKRSVTVEIAGQRFTLKTDADDAYVHELAAFVTQKLSDARTGARAFSAPALAILAALQIADELFQARAGERALKDDVRQRTRTVLDMVEKALGDGEPAKRGISVPR